VFSDVLPATQIYQQTYVFKTVLSHFQVCHFLVCILWSCIFSAPAPPPDQHRLSLCWRRHAHAPNDSEAGC